jgi:hypothetical protein
LVQGQEPAFRPSVKVSAIIAAPYTKKVLTRLTHLIALYSDSGGVSAQDFTDW